MHQRHLCFQLYQQLKVCCLILSSLCFPFLICHSRFLLSPFCLLFCARSPSSDLLTCQIHRSRLRIRGLPIQLGSRLPRRACALRCTPILSLSALPPAASSPPWQRPSSSLPAISPHLQDLDLQLQPPQPPETAPLPPLTPQKSSY